LAEDLQARRGGGKSEFEVFPRIIEERKMETGRKMVSETGGWSQNTSTSLSTTKKFIREFLWDGFRKKGGNDRHRDESRERNKEEWEGGENLELHETDLQLGLR